MFFQHSFLTVLDAKRVPKREHLGAKIASKIDFFRFVFYCFPLGFSMIFGFRRVTSCSRRGIFCIFFFVLFFVPFWVAFWCHFGSPNGAKLEQKSNKKNIKKSDDLQERPRWAKGWFWEGLGVALGRSGAAPGAFWRHFGSKKRMFSEFSWLKTWFCSELCILAKDFLKSCCLLMLL